MRCWCQLQTTAQETQSLEKSLYQSTAQATKLSPLPSATHCADDQKCTVAGLLWSKQRGAERCWDPESLHQPLLCQVELLGEGKNELCWAPFAVRPSRNPPHRLFLCYPLGRGRSAFGAGQRVGGETFPRNLAAVLQPYSRSNVRSGILALSVECRLVDCGWSFQDVQSHPFVVQVDKKMVEMFGFSLVEEQVDGLFSLYWLLGGLGFF